MIFTSIAVILVWAAYGWLPALILALMHAALKTELESL